MPCLQLFFCCAGLDVLAKVVAFPFVVLVKLIVEVVERERVDLLVELLDVMLDVVLVDVIVDVLVDVLVEERRVILVIVLVDVLVEVRVEELVTISQSFQLQPMFVLQSPSFFSTQLDEPLHSPLRHRAAFTEGLRAFLTMKLCETILHRPRCVVFARDSKEQQPSKPD